MRIPTVILLVLAASAAGGAKKDDGGQLAQAFDGDTIEVRFNDGNLRIRLHAIDAPDQEQDLSAEAGDALRMLLENRPIRVVRVATTHGRLAGIILVDGTDINGELVRAGFAYAHRKYLGLSDFDRHYCALEHEARVARRGIWALPPENRVAPWQLRQYYRGERMTFTDFATQSIADCAAAAGKPDTQVGTIAADPVPGLTPPDPECHVKGNITASGKRKYYVSGMRAYAGIFISEADGERWFCNEAEAEAEGWVRARGR